MNRLLKAAAALLCAFGLNSFANAQLTTVTASHIYMNGVLIPAGTVTFTPVSANGTPIAFAEGGGGLNAPFAWSCTITSGAITGSCQIPDSALTTPANISYQVTVIQTSGLKQFTLQAVPGITGTTWPLDDYGPPANTTNVQPIQLSYGTAAAPSPCLTPSLYIRNNSGGLLYMCVASVPVLVTSSGGGSVTAAGMASAVVGEAGCTTAHFAWIPETLTCEAVGGGSSGLPDPGTNGIVTRTGTNTTGDAGPLDVYKAITNATLFNQYLVDAIPTTASTWDVLIGTGVGPNLTPSSSTVGGQADTFIGWHAGHSCTSCREGTFIGYQAGANITGNGSGPDDMIATIIGSQAGLLLTNLGGATTIIGQKAATNATSSADDVYIGVHAGAAFGVTSDSVIIGSELAPGGGAASAAGVVLIGNAVLAGGNSGTLSGDVIIGTGAASAGTTFSNNVIIGGGAAPALTTSSNDVIIGDAAGGGTTGASNIVIGQSAGTHISTGGQNVIIETQSDTVSTGAGNQLIGSSAGQNVTTGQTNVNIGFQAHQSGNTNSTVIIGRQAGNVDQVDGFTAVGFGAGFTMTTGAGNSFFGNSSGLALITGSNDTGIGDHALSLLSGAESNDTGVGEAAQVAAGISNAIQIGPGTNPNAGSVQFGSWNIGVAPTAATLTPGTGATSATCNSAACTSRGGTFTLVGGTATTGTVVTIAWTATPVALVCEASQNGGTSWLGIGNSVATTTGFNVTAANTVASATVVINYSCHP